MSIKNKEMGTKREEMDIIDELVEEAIAHFNTPRKRKTSDDSRFFFKKNEVNFILKSLDNPNSVKVNTILNDDKTVFCFELIRVISLVETRRKRK